MGIKAGKIWGNTELVHANGVLEFHRIEFNAGYKCSEHAHQFKWNGFLDQIAFGGGFGLRINLDFFIIRADIAIPIKNPAIPFNDSNNNLSSAWIFDDKFKDRKQYHPLQFNLGIGYPF